MIWQKAQYKMLKITACSRSGAADLLMLQHTLSAPSMLLSSPYKPKQGHHYLPEEIKLPLHLHLNQPHRTKSRAQLTPNLARHGTRRFFGDAIETETCSASSDLT